MSDWYYLDGRTPVRFESLDEMIAWHKANPALVESQRRVAQTTWGPFWVSTVFLGLDHSYGDGPPVLFETMVFARGGMSDLWCERGCTWNEALLSHAAGVRVVKQPSFWWMVAKRLPHEVRHRYWCSQNTEWSWLRDRNGKTWNAVFDFYAGVSAGWQRPWRLLKQAMKSFDIFLARVFHRD